MAGAPMKVVKHFEATLQLWAMFTARRRPRPLF